MPQPILKNLRQKCSRIVKTQFYGQLRFLFRQKFASEILSSVLQFLHILYIFYWKILANVFTNKVNHAAAFFYNMSYRRLQQHFKCDCFAMPQPILKNLHQKCSIIVKNQFCGLLCFLFQQKLASEIQSSFLAKAILLKNYS